MSLVDNLNNIFELSSSFVLQSQLSILLHSTSLVCQFVHVVTPICALSQVSVSLNQIKFHNKKVSPLLSIPGHVENGYGHFPCACATAKFNPQKVE